MSKQMFQTKSNICLDIYSTSVPIRLARVVSRGSVLATMIPSHSKVFKWKCVHVQWCMNGAYLHLSSACTHACLPACLYTCMCACLPYPPHLQWVPCSLVHTAASDCSSASPPAAPPYPSGKGRHRKTGTYREEVILLGTLLKLLHLSDQCALDQKMSITTESLPSRLLGQCCNPLQCKYTHICTPYHCFRGFCRPSPTHLK